MGQIPRSIERISSYNHSSVAINAKCIPMLHCYSNCYSRILVAMGFRSSMSVEFVLLRGVTI